MIFCQFWTLFWSAIIWPHFASFYGGGGRRGENYRKMSLFGTPISGFCYIVVSTFFGPSGPPPGHPFWTRFWKKYSLFVGNGHFIGSILGVKNGGSFCRKLQNFKKFIKRDPPGPPPRFWSFWPPGTPPWKLIFEHFLGQFLTSLFDPQNR
jgi:hypothetical protein